MLAIVRPPARIAGLIAVALLLMLPAQVPASADGSGITGSVTVSGAPLRSVRVAAFEATQDPATQMPMIETLTRRTGEFRLRVPAGDYRLMVDAGDHGYRPRWWRGADGQVGTVHVEPGQTVAGLTVAVTGSGSFPAVAPGALIPAAPPGLDSRALDPIESYQGQRTCRRTARKGTLALRSLILATYGDGAEAYLNRPCQSDTSEHYDGRAIDWMVNSRIADQALMGDALARWVTAGQGDEPGVVARRLGIMYIIWRGRIWKQYEADQGWQAYSDCTRRGQSKVVSDNGCHRNHIHISLTHRGAQLKSTWWQAAGLQ